MADMLKIKKIDTSKHKIPQRELMEMGVIPHHPAVSIMSGSQGGGKSTLCANMLTNKLMYGISYEGMEKELKKCKDLPPRGYFDAIFLMIGSDDDMYDHLIEQGIIQENHVCHMPTGEDVKKVIDGQKAAIKRAKGDMLKVPKILFIFDDIINDGKLLRDKNFLEVFVKGRHINSSTWLLTQYLNLCPKALRLQGNYLFVFKSNRAELQVLSDQFCPPNMTKQEFSQLVQETTKDDDENKNNFMVIAKRAPEDQRFRKNLNEYVNLKRLHCNPKPPKKRTKKEQEDLEFDNEITIQELQKQIKIRKPRVNPKSNEETPLQDKRPNRELSEKRRLMVRRVR